MITTPAQRDLARFTAALRTQGESPRYWRINAMESWYLGTQYDARPSFWSTDVPLRERAPVVQSQFVRSAVQRLATLVFGDRSFPRVKVSADGYRFTLTDAERTALQALADETIVTLALSKRMREVITEGLKTGAACVVVGLVEGRPTLSLLPSKWCTPTLRRDGSVSSLTVEYKHQSTEDPSRWFWYRREISETSDTTYDALPVEDGRAPDWSRASSVSIPLEFCPVVWIRNDAEATATSDQIDGHALVEGLEDEVEALDFELSQLYRNALYNGEPQLVQIGVDGDSSPLNGPVGHTSAAPGFSWFNSVLPGWARGGATDAALKKAPGKLWKLPAGGDAKMVESTGAGAEIIKGAIKELLRVLMNSSGVVLFDVDALGSGDVSGRALELLHAPMLDHADNLRVEYGDALCRILDTMLRVMSSTIARTVGVVLRSYDAAAPALERLYGRDATGARRWVGPRLTLTWGEYFSPSPSDRQAAVSLAKDATGGRPVLTQRSAVASLAAMFGVEDVDAELEALAAEEGASRDAVASTMRALGGAPEPTPEPETDAPEVTITAPDAPTEKAADAALNGAQVASLVDIVVKVATGELPRDAAIAIIERAFLVDTASAESILGSAGKGFRPAVASQPVTGDGAAQ